MTTSDVDQERHVLDPDHTDDALQQIALARADDPMWTISRSLRA